MHNIVILGCGWLGQQIATTLIAHGYRVTGTRQSLAGCAELAPEIHPQVLSFPCDNFPTELVDDAFVIVALPASVPNYLAALGQISQACTRARRVFFCSSTGIYAGLSGHLQEAMVPTHLPLQPTASTDLPIALQAVQSPALALSRVQRLMAAEFIMRQHANTVVLRLAGLIGPGRHPANFCRHGALRGADLPVNMVHSRDVAHFLLAWLAQPEPPQETVINLCSPEHPSKQLFYRAACQHAKAAPPSFHSEDADELPRTIDVQLSLTLASFQYEFASPIQAIAYCS